MKESNGREIDWRCFWGKHAYGPWREPSFSGTVWHVCRRCGQWDWKRTRREAVIDALCGVVAFIGIVVAPIIAAAIKIDEWLP